MNPRTLALSAAFLAAAAPSLVQAQSTWAGDANGNWNSTVSPGWTAGGVPNATGAVANINAVNITADRTITLNVAATVGTINFADATTASNNWIIAGTNVLTLDVASGNATLNVTNQTATINAPIAGADPILVPTTSLGNLVLGGTNTFTNTLTIASGARVQAANTAAFGAGGAGNETIIQAGGTYIPNNISIGATEVFRVAGYGAGGVGAISNSGTGGTNGPSNVVLTANAAFGGANRWDIRNAAGVLDLGGFRMTKIGANQVAVVGGTVTSGMIDIASGTFGFEANTVVQGTGLISVNAGATLGLWANVAGAQTRPVLLGGAVSDLGSPGATSISMPLTLNGYSNGTVSANANSVTAILNLLAPIAENRAGTNLTKGGTGKVVFGAATNFTGALIAADQAGSAGATTSNVSLGTGSSFLGRHVYLGSGTTFDSSGVGGFTVPSGGAFAVGRAAVNGATGFTAGTDVVGSLTVNSGATLSAGYGLANTVRTATFGSDLTLNSANVSLDLGSTLTPGGLTSDLLAVNGNLTATGTNNINLYPAVGAVGTGFANGNYTLATYTGALTGSAANFSIANASNYRQTFTIDTASTPGSVLLNVSGSAMTGLSWVNDTASGVWNTNGDVNWGGEKFYDLDDAFFQDNGNGVENISISGVVRPSAMRFDSGVFNFAGPGKISGPGGISHGSGDQANFLTDFHDFTGDVVVTGGSVGATNLTGTTTSLGSTTNRIILDGGALNYLGGNATVTRPIRLGIDQAAPTAGGDGTIRVAEKMTNLNITSALVGGTNNTATGLIKTGPGTLQIGANVSFPGNITVKEGILRAGTVSSLQSKTVTVESGATFDPNGQTGAAAPRPTLSITGNGVSGLAAIWNSGGAVTNNPLYNVLNLNGDASVGSIGRWDFNGAGGLTVNGGTYTLSKVGTGESWWAPNPGATVGDINVVSGAFGVQATDNLGDNAYKIYVRPGGQLATFGAGNTNLKPVVLDGGQISSTGGAATAGQIWRGGVTLTRNSIVDNRGTAVNNELTFDSTVSGNAPLSLGGKTLYKVGTGNNAGGTLFLKDSGATGIGSGDGNIIHYAGIINQSTGFKLNGAGTLDLKGHGSYFLSDAGGLPSLTKKITFNGGLLQTIAGSHTVGTSEIATYGRVINNTAGTTLTLGDITATGANRGGFFGTTGTVNLTTINGVAPVVGAGNRLGVDWSAGATPAAAGFATVSPSGTVGTLATTALGAGSGAADDVLNSAAYTVAANQTVRTLVSSADVNISSGATLTIADGGIIMRGADHSINTPAAGTGKITTGALDGRLVINTPEPLDTRGTLNFRAQIVDAPVAGGPTGAFRPVTLVKQGTGQITTIGLDNGGSNVLGNLNTGGAYINAGRFNASGMTPLGLGPVTVNDGGQIALFNTTGAAGQSSFVANNITGTGWGAGENGGYFGMIRMAANVNVSGNIQISGETRIQNQNGGGAISGPISGTGNLLLTGNNLTWLTSSSSDFSGIVHAGYRNDLNTGGTILVSKLADGGQASSIGKGGAGAENLIINTSILRYVGTGDSTDRLFTLGNGYNLNAAGNVIVSASGYGPLNFTNTGTLGVTEGSIRNLVLRAENLSTGAIAAGGSLPVNTFAPILTNPTGADRANYNTLQKDGAGTWVLTGNHTYGIEHPNVISTVVNDGILRLGDGGTSGMIGIGAVQLQNNGKLQINRSDTATLSQPITSNNTAGETEIQQVGSGTTVLSGAQDNSSSKVRVNSGTLELAKASNGGVHAAALTVTVNGGTLKLGGTGDDQIFDGATSSTWTTVFMNGGTFDMNGRNEAVYRVEGNGGVITNTAAGTNSTLTLGGSLLAVGGAGNGASMLGGGVGSPIQDGAGTLAVAKTGTGVINLVGANTYSGSTQIVNGTLVVGNGGTTGSLGSGPVTLGNDVYGTGTLAIQRSNAYSLTNAISGGGNLQQLGTGTTTISSPKAYTGDTIVSRGVLNVDLSSANDVLPTASRVRLEGGAFKVTGGSSGSSSQTVSSLVIAGGDINVDASAGATTLSLPSSWNRLAGGTTNIGTTGAATVGTTITNTNGVIGSATAAYATLNGTDWAAGDGSKVVPFAGYSGSLGSGLHTDITSAFALGSNASTSTLRLNTPGAAVNLGGNTLTLEQGAILGTSNLVGGSLITGGTLTGAAAAGSEVIAHHFPTGIPNALNIGAVIANNGSNITSFSKAGPGVVALTGTNTYSGDTHINQGILAVGAFGTTGTLGSGTVYNDSVLAFGRTDSLTVTNAIVGSGTVVQAGGGTLNLQGTNTFTGGLVIAAGTVQTDRGFANGNNAAGNLFGTAAGSLQALASLSPENAAGLGGILLGVTSANDFGLAATSGPVAFLSAAGADFANPIVVGGGTGTVTIGSFRDTLPGNPTMFLSPITMNRDTTLQGGNVDRTSFLSSISGTGNLIIANGGTAQGRVTLEADNTFVGDVTINSDTILQVGTGSFAAPRNQIPDTATVTLNALSRFQLNGDSETINQIQATANDARLLSIAGGGQVLTLLNGGTFNGIYDGGLNGGMTLENAGGILTIGGTSDNGTGRLLSTGGTIVLNKTSSTAVHAAAVDLTINGGTVQVGGSFTGAVPNYAAANGTAVTLPGNFVDQIYDGSAGASSSTVIHSGKLDLNGKSEGIGRLDGTGGAVTNEAAGTTSTLFVGTANHSNLFTAGYAGQVKDGAGIVALSKVGTGVAVFSGDLTHTGGTTINAGAIQIGNGGTTGNISGDVNIANANQSSFWINRAGTVSISANISGVGPLINNGSGTVSLTGTNAYTGSTTINGGILSVGDGGTSGTIGSGNVTINSGTVLQFHRSDSALSISSALAGAGSVVQKGTGTTTITGVSTHTGLTTIRDGRLNVNADWSMATGNVNVMAPGTLGGTGKIGGKTTVAGRISPGNSPGTISFTDTLTLQVGSVYDWEPGDLIKANGATLVNSTSGPALNILGALGAWNDPVIILEDTTANPISGLFSVGGTLQPEGAIFMAGGQQWQISYVAGSGNDVSLMMIPEPGTVTLGALGLAALGRRRRKA